MPSRYLYLVRHCEQQDAEHGLPDGPLSPRGVRQANAIAERLGGVPFTGAWTSPLQRAQETARIMTERLPALTPEPSALLMDCIPSGPTVDLPHAFKEFFGGVTTDEIEAGEAQMADATAEWMTPPPGGDDRHDLLLTHNFVIGWFVRETFGAPAWRWLGLNQANAGLTIIRVRSAKPPVLVTHNDLGHLPPELRTGLPVEQPY
jgi:broad specificity phosphatase PhoE